MSQKRTQITKQCIFKKELQKDIIKFNNIIDNLIPDDTLSNIEISEIHESIYEILDNIVRESIVNMSSPTYHEELETYVNDVVQTQLNEINESNIECEV